MDIKIRRKKVLFRSHHRGFKEADIILGGYADTHIQTMDAAELDVFEALLDNPDQDLYDWITGKTAPPAEFDNPMLDRVRQFGYSDQPIRK